MIYSSKTTFFRTKSKVIMTKNISLHHKINRNASDNSDYTVNSCYQRGFAVGKNPVQEKRAFPEHPRKREQSHESKRHRLRTVARQGSAACQSACDSRTERHPVTQNEATENEILTNNDTLTV